MIGKKLGTLATFLAVVPLSAAFAADLRVPQDHGDIASALDAAVAGDRVLVAPGTYDETGLELRGGVTLEGTGGEPSDVVIDGGGQARILSCDNAKVQAHVLNLTFANGLASGASYFESSGGAILCNYSNLSVKDCVFSGNRADRNGGAIWVFESSPQLINCRFLDNVAVAGGGGVDCTFQSSPLIQDCWFESNQADWGAALSCRDFSSPNVIGTVFTRNAAVGSHAYGGGVFSDLDSQPRMALCTFHENSADYGGGFASFVNSGPSIARCTLVGNQASVHGSAIYSFDTFTAISSSIIAFHDGEGVYAGGGAGPQIVLSDLFANAGGDWVGSAAPGTLGEDNFSEDPLFCATAADDPLSFNLQEFSPCHPDSNGGLTLGAWPAGCDNPLPLLYAFDADWQGNSAMLSWQIPAGSGESYQFRLTGALQATPDEEWDIPFEDLGDGNYVAEDLQSSANGDGPLVFRLYLSVDGENWSLLNEIELLPVPSLPGIGNLKAWPNPFNPATSISFSLDHAQPVRVSVYDLNGRRIKLLADEVLPAGLNERAWNGRDDRGAVIASGTYVVVVDGRDRRLTRKVTLLK